MGRVVHVYTDWQNLAVPGTGGASVDLLEVKLGAAQFAYVMGAYLFQSSEEGVTDIEEMKVALKRASGSYTSGGGIFYKQNCQVLKFLSLISLKLLTF
jgi:hypothetical protein